MSFNSQLILPGIARRWGRILSLGWAALLTGSRTIAFGDNSELFRELAERDRPEKSGEKKPLPRQP